MIPKIIHWCWLSETYPELVSKCLQTWKKFCPDYEIVRWDLKKSDLTNTPKWCQIAYENRLYAFCADFIRARALYEYGGVYLDSDVCLRVKDPFKEYEGDNIWIPFEVVDKLETHYYNGVKYTTGKNINPVFMGAVPHHPFFKEVLDRYWTLDDEYALKASECKSYTPIAPAIFSKEMEKYGMVYRNKEQYLKDGIHLLTNKRFDHLGCMADKRNMKAIHLCTHTWIKGNIKY